jgi:superfamily I DNA and/or RNA helicase
MPIPPNVMGSNGGTNGPYSVNSVLHNRATVEVSGLHIRDLPMTSTGLPCLPSGAPLPPNVLFKLHHDELLNQDATLNEYSNKLQMLTNRVDRIDKAGGGGEGVGSGDMMLTTANISYESIIEDGNFISKVVDNILTNTNLSDIINQIEPLQKENEALRILLNSQQKTLNELSGLVMKLLTKGLPECIPSNIDNSEYNTYDANTIAEYVGESVVDSVAFVDTIDGVDAAHSTENVDGGNDGDDGGDSCES